jgi:SNF2 family DNA or RNA helicase
MDGNRKTMSFLAANFDVNIRTIRRDIESLSVDYPLCTLQGNGGGVMLIEHKHLHRRILSQGQITALQTAIRTSDSETAEALQSILRAYAQEKGFSPMKDHNLPIRASPYAHQRAAANTALEMFISNKSHGYGLLFEMGCGKTITAIAITGRLYQLGKANRLLIVAPLSILGVWDEEFRKFANFDYTIAVLNGSGSKKADPLRNMTGSPLQIAVINYESAWRLEKEILAWNPDMIICDESHKIKCHKTNASKAMHRLGKAAAYRLILTGTVITNKALDVFSQYKFLNPAIFGNSFYSFRNKYFDMCGYGNHTPILKRRMEPELTERLHRIAYRATKAECLDLPEITDIIRYVELEKSAMRIYQELVKDSFTEISGQEVTATNILTRLLRLSQLTGGFLGGDEDPKPYSVSKAKLDALADIIETAQSEGQKLVIIARFTAEIDAIKKLLEKQNIGYSAISGETKDRTAQVRQFQEDTDITVFIGQIATAGLGITLTAASTLVFYSLDYSMSNFEQAKARIHRVGQKFPCTYVYLTAKNTVDEKILEALRNKADLAKKLVDDYRSGINPFL